MLEHGIRKTQHSLTCPWEHAGGKVNLMVIYLRLFLSLPAFSSQVLVFLPSCRQLFTSHRFPRKLQEINRLTCACLLWVKVERGKGNWILIPLPISIFSFLTFRSFPSLCRMMGETCMSGTVREGKEGNVGKWRNGPTFPIQRPLQTIPKGFIIYLLLWMESFGKVVFESRSRVHLTMLVLTVIIYLSAYRLIHVAERDDR